MAFSLFPLRGWPFRFRGFTLGAMSPEREEMRRRLEEYHRTRHLPETSELVAWLDEELEELVKPEPAQALARIEARYPDILVTLERAFQQAEIAEALALAGLLGARFGWMSGRSAETAALCLRALALEGGHPVHRALAHEGAAASLLALGDLTAAATHALEASERYGAFFLLDDLLRLGNLRGQIACEQGDLGLAEELLREVLEVALDASGPDPWAEATALGHLGVVACRAGRPDEATRILDHEMGEGDQG